MRESLALTTRWVDCPSVRPQSPREEGFWPTHLPQTDNKRHTDRPERRRQQTPPQPGGRALHLLNWHIQPPPAGGTITWPHTRETGTVHRSQTEHNIQQDCPTPSRHRTPASNTMKTHNERGDPFHDLATSPHLGPSGESIKPLLEIKTKATRGWGINTLPLPGRNSQRDL